MAVLTRIHMNSMVCQVSERGVSGLLQHPPGRPQSGGADAAGNPRPTSDTWLDIHHTPVAGPATNSSRLGSGLADSKVGFC